MWSRFRLPLRGLAQVFMTHDNALTIDGNDHKRSRPLGLPELISLFVERVEVFGCPDYQLLDLPFADLGSGSFPQRPRPSAVVAHENRVPWAGLNPHPSDAGQSSLRQDSRRVRS